MFLDHDVELFTKVEVFEFKKDFNFELGAFHGIDIHFVVQVRIVHFLFAHSVVEVLFARIVKCLVGWKLGENYRH